jgi:SAM-dependent methyltransferase
VDGAADLSVQTGYWNGAAAGKTFTHPLPLEALRARLAPGARVLDYGCGYGRTCAELAAAGFRATGVDISDALITRGRAEHPELDLLPFDGTRAPYADASFDACLLFAVLTCIPTDGGLARAVAEARRLVRPGGLLVVSDYILQTDARNLARYAQFAPEFGRYGIFRSDGAVFRHFGRTELPELFASEPVEWRRLIRVRTLNGHESDVVQMILRLA